MKGKQIYLPKGLYQELLRLKRPTESIKDFIIYLIQFYAFKQQIDLYYLEQSILS